MSIHEVFTYLRASDADEAIAFYGKAFGATEKFRLVEPGGRVGHAELGFGETTVMIADAFPEYGMPAPDPDAPSTVLIHLHVDNADALIERAIAAGATLVQAAEDQFYGERSGKVRDPYGYEWLIGHSIEEVSTEEMQRRYTELLSGAGA